MKLPFQKMGSVFLNEKYHIFFLPCFKRLCDCKMNVWRWKDTMKPMKKPTKWAVKNLEGSLIKLIFDVKIVHLIHIVDLNSTSSCFFGSHLWANFSASAANWSIFFGVSICQYKLHTSQFYFIQLNQFRSIFFGFSMYCRSPPHHFCPWKSAHFSAHYFFIKFPKENQVPPKMADKWVYSILRGAQCAAVGPPFVGEIATGEWKFLPQIPPTQDLPNWPIADFRLPRSPQD